MREGRRVLDADAHQMEPASLWRRYIDPSLREEAPRLEQAGERRGMVVEGEWLTDEQRDARSSPRLRAVLTQHDSRFKKAREARFSAESRLRDMDEEGVDTQILYPTVGGHLLGRAFRSPALLAACCRAYNRWSREYCSVARRRLRWSAMLPRQEVPLAIEEARRSARAGATAFYLHPNPVGGRPLHHPDFDPLWAKIEDLDLPICIHDSMSPRLPSYGHRMETPPSSQIIAQPFEAMSAMVSLIWYGILERYPRLRVVHVGADAGWVPYWLQRMEQQWRFSRNADHADLRMRPTDYFLRSVWVTCRSDEMMLRSTVELAGDENLLFSSDYPQPQGTWPWSLGRFEEQPIPESSKQKILWTNAARAFGLHS